MANVNVSYDEMNNAAARLVRGETDLNNSLTELQSFIQDLLSNGFVTDSASVSFGEAYSKFTDGTRKGLEALSAMSKYLNDAARSLKETDEGLVVQFG